MGYFCLSPASAFCAFNYKSHGANTAKTIESILRFKAALVEPLDSSRLQLPELVPISLH
jgi:hypothetical protein